MKEQMIKKIADQGESKVKLVKLGETINALTHIHSDSDESVTTTQRKRIRKDGVMN